MEITETEIIQRLERAKRLKEETQYLGEMTNAYELACENLTYWKDWHDALIGRNPNRCGQQSGREWVA